MPGTYFLLIDDNIGNHGPFLSMVECVKQINR